MVIHIYHCDLKNMSRMCVFLDWNSKGFGDYWFFYLPVCSVFQVIEFFCFWSIMWYLLVMKVSIFANLFRLFVNSLLVFRYRVNLLKPTVKSLQLANKISKRIDDRGFLSVQYMINFGAYVTFIEFEVKHQIQGGYIFRKPQFFHHFLMDANES